MTTKATIRTATLLVMGLFCACFCNESQAKQFKQHIQGREVVVHTNPIPVVLHRMVPPQHGRHVTQREVAKGKLPQPQPTPTVFLNRSRK